MEPPAPGERGAEEEPTHLRVLLVSHTFEGLDHSMRVELVLAALKAEYGADTAAPPVVAPLMVRRFLGLILEEELKRGAVRCRYTYCRWHV